MSLGTENGKMACKTARDKLAIGTHKTVCAELVVFRAASPIRLPLASDFIPLIKIL